MFTTASLGGTLRFNEKSILTLQAKGHDFSFIIVLIMAFADLVLYKGTFSKGVTINFMNLHPTREAQRLSCLERSFKWDTLMILVVLFHCSKLNKCIAIRMADRI